MKTKWISSNKKLPPYGERVLICVVSTGGPSTLRIGIGQRVSTDRTGEHWSTNVTNNPPVVGWMRLPEPLEDYKATNIKSKEL